jgi:peptidoglycan/xylan/chitin deacetylase (PgdA/CDA1 family)
MSIRPEPAMGPVGSAGAEAASAVVSMGARSSARSGADVDRAIASALRQTGFRRWFGALNRLRGRQRAVIVMYHSFTPGGWAAIAPDTLRWHLELIRDGYEVVSLARLVAALANREPTDHMAALTVDDGYEDFVTVAYPMLSELRLPATLFVPTGFIGGHSDWYDRSRKPLRVASAELLRDVDRSLVTLGSHSHHHRLLVGAHAETLEAEMRRSKSDLEALVKAPVTLFAYPSGGRASYNAATIRALRAAGFAAAVTTCWETYSSRAELMSLPRISFDETDGPEDVRAKLAGDFDWVNGRELAAHVMRSTLGRGRSASPTG